MKDGLRTIRFLPEDAVREIFIRFKNQNPDPKSELVSINPFTLLVSVVLSAQTTDKSVNKATGPLYEIARTPLQMARLGEEGIVPYIRSIGLYRSKAKHVARLSEQLVELYGPDAGCVVWEKKHLLNTKGFPRFPRTREEFQKLPGVGRKTANVVLNVVYDEPVMPVDTHLLRISPRIGLSDGQTPETVEADLLRIIPAEFLTYAHHWLILHGRYVCTARSPDCENCLIRDLCAKNLEYKNE